LGPEYNGTLWMGSARSNSMVGANGGSLYRFKMTNDRMHVDVSADPRLANRVADNLFRPQKFDGTESETLQIGTGFGITPDIEEGPDGNLYVVSNTDNVIYEISRVTPTPPPGGRHGGAKQPFKSPGDAASAMSGDLASTQISEGFLTSLVPLTTIAPRGDFGKLMQFGGSLIGAAPLKFDDALLLRSAAAKGDSGAVRTNTTTNEESSWSSLLGTSVTSLDLDALK
jgi:hypothetical protein